MSETKHSPEPWYQDPEDCAWLGGASVFSEKGPVRLCEVSEADARRIVACVNACAGLPTEALEAGALGRALDALGDMASQHRCGCGHPACNRCADDGENAAALRALGRLP